jgi:hypothetical protein
MTPPYCCAIDRFSVTSKHVVRSEARGGKRGEWSGKHRSLLLRNRVSRCLHFNSFRMELLRHNMKAACSSSWPQCISYSGKKGGRN